MSYPNQRKMKVIKEAVEKGEHKPYLVAYNDTLSEAAKELNGNAFKAYIYLLSNQNNYEFWFSPQHLVESYGLGKTAAKAVVAELMAAGYITEDGANHYTFYDKKQEQLPDFSSFIEKRWYGGKLYTKAQLFDMVAQQGGCAAEAEIVWKKMEEN